MSKNSRIKMMVVTCLALFMAMLDTLVLGVALPSIQASFEAGISELSWFMNAYTLIFAVLLIPASILGERFGRKRMFLTGIAIFTFGSLLSALSVSSMTLSLARAVQGAGGAFIMPLSLTLIYQAFPKQLRAAAIGIWSGISGLGLALGPLVGGLIIEGFPWQMIFWVNVPVGIVCMIAGFKWLRESKGSVSRLDMIAVFLLGFGLLGIVYGLVNGNTEGWSHVTVWGSMLCGAFLLGMFVIRTLRQQDPMVQLRLFGNRVYAALNFSGFWMSAGIFGAIFLLTLFLQQAQGYSALGAGLREMAWTGMTMLTAPFAGLLAARFGTRPILTIGLSMQAAALMYFAWITWEQGAVYPFSLLLPGMLVAGAGMGLAFAPLSHGIMSSVTESEAGHASGMNNAFRELGGVFGVAIAGMVFQWGDPVASPDAFADHLVPALAVCAMMIVLGLVCAVMAVVKEAKLHQALQQAEKLTEKWRSTAL